MIWWYLAAAMAALLLYMWLEAGWLKVEHITASSRLGLRLAVISDLHPSFCRITSNTARAVLANEKPDLFLFLGDAIDYPNHIAKAAAWLGNCAGGVPSFAVSGNHESRFFKKNGEYRREFSQALSEAGIQWVADTRFVFSKGSRHLTLTAIDDYRHTPESFPPPGVSGSGVSGSGPADFHLVFTHNPQRITELPEGYADFAVAGHFHGGQIWMPFGLEFRLFRKEPLGRIGIRRGLHLVNGIPLYLTRGIGNVMFPLRLGARPEITILDL